MFETRLMTGRVVFLDIDGVLQPITSQERGQFDLRGLRAQLATQVDAEYGRMSEYDIGAVRYDWWPRAVQLLKDLCVQGKASIVVSSAWRKSKTFKQLLLLFRMHDLERFVVGTTPVLGPRDLEIQEFLNQHAEIERFVILDDAYRHELGTRFGSEFVQTDWALRPDTFARALAILQRAPKKNPAFLRRFDAFLNGSVGIRRMSLNIRQIGILRRTRNHSRCEFLERLCEAVAVSPNLEAMEIRDMDNDFTFEEYAAEKAEQRIELAAKKNPSMKRLLIQETNDGTAWGAHEPFKTVISWKRS